MLESSVSKLSDLNIGKDWTLFLDRDGVINHKIDNDYVKKVDEFRFLEKAVLAIKKFRQIFGVIVVVTNQQGIGKGLMGHDDLARVHNHMINELVKQEANIDKVYYCPDLAGDNPVSRKPNTGMALQAQTDFSTIDFNKSVMVGDSLSDIQFGDRLGMQKVYINKDTTKTNTEALALANYSFASIWELSQTL